MRPVGDRRVPVLAALGHALEPRSSTTRPAYPLSGFRPSEGPSVDHVATEERSIKAHRQRHEHDGGNGENDHLPDGSVWVVLDHLWRCG